MSHRRNIRPKIDRQLASCLNILTLLNRSMSFDELWEEGCFTSKRHLSGYLRKLIDAGMIVRKLDFYYIAENGVNFLSFYPNWKVNEVKVVYRNDQRRNSMP